MPISRFRARALSASWRILIVAGIDFDVRGVEEEIESVEADALELGVGREVEHRVQIDRRFGPGAFADHARPGSVVKFGVVVGVFVGHGRRGFRVQ